MPFFFNRHYSPIKILFFLGEGLLIFGGVLAVLIHSTGWDIFHIDPAGHLLRSISVTLVFQLSFYFYDLYDFRAPGSTNETLLRILQAFGTGCAVLGILYLLFPPIIISNTVFGACCLLIGLTIFAWRALYYLVLEKKMFTLGIVLLGTGEMARAIFREINSDRESGFTVKALVGPETPGFDHEGVPRFAELAAIARDPHISRVSRIVVALDDRRGVMPVEELLKNKLQGKIIDNGISFYESLTAKILVQQVNPAWLIFSDGFEYTRRSYLIKRVLDLSLAFTGLLLSLPIGLITALFIKLESPGPVFYKQERVGELGASFLIVKFRSMRQDAEKDGAVWARKNDARVTRVGRFIRKVRIDEIPQVWNVIRGQMSFVGPRPERPIFVEQLVQKLPYYSLRHAVKPGITGWAQICYPYGASEEDALRKLEYDLYYIKHRSLLMDLLIIFRTVKTVLFRIGSR